MKFRLLLILFIVSCGIRTNAQVYSYPYIRQNVSCTSGTELILMEVEKKSTACFITLGLKLHNKSSGYAIYPKGDKQCYSIVDNKTGKLYYYVNDAIIHGNLPWNGSKVFTLEFEKIPDELMEFDLIEGDIKNKDNDWDFRGVILTNKNSSSYSQDNLNINIKNYTPEQLRFFQENAKKASVMTMPCGWQYEEIQKGTGKKANMYSEKILVRITNVRQYKSEHNLNLQRQYPSAYHPSPGESEEYYTDQREEGEIWYDAFFLGRFGPLQDALLNMQEGTKWRLYFPAYLYCRDIHKQHDIKYETWEVEIVKVQDGIREYVRVEDDEIFYAKGDGLTFGQFLNTNNETSIENLNAVVLGGVKNYSDKTQRVRVRIAFQIKFTAGVSLLNQSSLEQVYDDKYYELLPGQSALLAGYLKFTQTAYANGLVGWSKGLDNYRPYYISIEAYPKEFPADVVKRQAELIETLRTNGNLPRKPGWEVLLNKNVPSSSSSSQDTKPLTSCYDINSVKLYKDDYCGTKPNHTTFQIKTIKCRDDKEYQYYYITQNDNSVACPGSGKAGYYKNLEGQPDWLLHETDFDKAMKNLCGCDK